MPKANRIVASNLYYLVAASGDRWQSRAELAKRLGRPMLTQHQIGALESLVSLGKLERATEKRKYPHASSYNVIVYRVKDV